MSSFESAATTQATPEALSSFSYDRILAIFEQGSATASSIGRSRKAKVFLKTAQSFETALRTMPSGMYQKSAGGDLANIFMPFQTNSGSGIMPCFHRDVATSGYGSPPIFKGAYDILPFEWKPTSSQYVYDKYAIPPTSGDALGNLLSGETYYGDSDRYINKANIRGVGIRLPAIGVGWGFTTDGFPWPSGASSTSGAFFKGGYLSGRSLDPSDYVAAPIDLRYDARKHVWTTREDGFWATISATSGAPNNMTVYAWTERQVGTSGAVTSVRNFRSGTFLVNPAFEINNIGVPINTNVWLQKSDPVPNVANQYPQGSYVFRASVPPGYGRYKVLMIIDDNNVNGRINWDYPRFHQ